MIERERDNMKVFLSLPMQGKSSKEIAEIVAKMMKAATSICNIRGENNGRIEFITNIYFTPDKEVQHMRPYCLGEAIKKMADCTLVVFHPDYRQFDGCYIEYEICNRYYINRYVLTEEELV